MFMRLTWGRVKSGLWDEYERTYRSLPVENVPGLKNRCLVQIEEKTDEGFTMTLWESRKAMEDFLASELYLTQVIPKLRPFFLGEFETTSCIVRYVHNLQDAAGSGIQID
jgi:heme-degrading monooxygenase HmoA